MIDILTYNDLLEIGENERDRMEFVLSAIHEHKGSELYKTAYDAELYYKHQNPTIMRFQKFVYNQFGQKVRAYHGTQKTKNGNGRNSNYTPIFM